VSRRPRVAHLVGSDLSLRFLLLGQLRALRDAGMEVTGISAAGPWTEELEREGIRHIALRHSRRAWSPGRDILLFFELVRIFRRERFDLVHTHMVKTGLVGRIAARVAGVPCVINTIHGLYATPDDRPLKRIPVHALERLAARFSDFELYQSEEDLEYARKAGIVRPDRSELLSSGIDLERFDPTAIPSEKTLALRSELGIPPDTVLVGTLGRLIANKGYRELFEAAAVVRQKHEEVRFLAVGPVDQEKDHPLGEEELERASRHFTFTGWRSEVPELLAAMDIFVLPSWREGLPRSAIEAAAMAKPLVLTDIRGCREVAQHGVEGLLVPVRDPARLAAAIERLVKDPALARGMGERARARAIERFDERRVADTTLRRTLAVLKERGVLHEAPLGSDVHPLIRSARLSDVDAMARLHREGLPDAFLPALGQRFLRRLYGALATDEGAPCFVADREGEIVGFVAGAMSVRDFYRTFYRRHGVRAAAAAAPRLVRPHVFRMALETARYPANGNSAGHAELLSIAVAPGWRSRGVGHDLVDALVGDLETRGASGLRVVVGASNTPANGFYERLGFTLDGGLSVHGRAPSNAWFMSLQGRGAGERCVG